MSELNIVAIGKQCVYSRMLYTDVILIRLSKPAKYMLYNPDISAPSAFI